jgi:hypothetical protein
VPQIVKADERGEGSILKGVVVAASADVVTVQHQTFRATEDQLGDAAGAGLIGAALAQKIEKVGGRSLLSARGISS